MMIIGDTDSDDFLFGFKNNDTFLITMGDDYAFGGRGDDAFIVAPQLHAVVYVNGGQGYDSLVLARDPISVEHNRGHMIIHYAYHMTIITDKIEEIVI